MKNPPLASPLVSIGKAARICGVHPDTLRTWERLGKIKPIRTKGGHRRYKLSDLIEDTKDTTIESNE